MPTTQKSIPERIADLEKPALMALITKLMEENPSLYKTLELALAQPGAPAKVKPKTQVSEAMYRKLIKSILKQQGHEYHGYGYHEEPEYISELEKIIETAVECLEKDDPEGAIIILRVLLEETTDDYDSEADYEGGLACVIQDIGMPLAEAILSADLDAQTRHSLQAAIQEIYEGLDESIEDVELAVILMALEYGWDEIPEVAEDENDEEDQEDGEDDEEPDWMEIPSLQTARLNVLERQNRTAEFLQLAEYADPRRHTLKLIQLGRTDEAISASQHLGYAGEILQVAQKLHEIGRQSEAIALAERGLSASKDYSIAVWLAPLEEAQGNIEMAIRAHRIAFDARPDITHYRKLKQLTGSTWETVRPELVKKASEGYGRDTLADIHLEEQEWDAAIALTGESTWSTSLLEKVADKLIPHRPDWVIRISLEQSDALIAETVSKRYPYAAQWLARAKKAYQAKGQSAEWQVNIADLRATYARRPALQKALAGL